MARLPRLFAPDQAQHILQRGNNRQPIFLDDQDYRTYLAMLGEALRAHGLSLHAYVLMPNHVHLLATPADAQSVPRVMQAVGRRYVRYFNARSGRTGTLWEGRYRSTIVEASRCLLACSLYIELNPVRAGMVELPEGYRWSSYGHHAGLAPQALITDHAEYWALGNTPFERQAAYLAQIREGLSDRQLAQIRAATNKGWVLGSPEFALALQSTANRRTLPLPKGRPTRQSPSSSTFAVAVPRPPRASRSRQDLDKDTTNQ